jgi:hypothetical protein
MNIRVVAGRGDQQHNTDSTSPGILHVLIVLSLAEVKVSICEKESLLRLAKNKPQNLLRVQDPTRIYFTAYEKCSNSVSFYTPISHLFLPVLHLVPLNHLCS